MSKISIAGLIVIALSLFILQSGISVARKPLTIPALQEWSDGEGCFIFSSNSRIVVDPQYSEALTPVARTLREDIYVLRGCHVSVITGSQPETGDIYLSLSFTGNNPGKEGYTMRIGDHITIGSPYKAGVFYGTRTLLQLLKQGDTVGCGVARDWPRYSERGLMVDNGRKYFTVEWLEEHIKELAYLKMNLFHWHLSDHQGFRLQCDSYPAIQSDKYLKKSEIKSL